MPFYIRNIHTAHHNIARLFLAKSKNTLQHLLIFAGRFVADFQRLGQFIGSDRFMLLTDKFVHHDRRTCHKPCRPTEHTVEKHHPSGRTPDPLQRILFGDKLGKYLSAQQQQKSKKYCLYQEIKQR